jgi:Tfp pilus assembly protein PilN
MLLPMQRQSRTKNLTTIHKLALEPQKSKSKLQQQLKTCKSKHQHLEQVRNNSHSQNTAFLNFTSQTPESSAQPTNKLIYYH